jgi:rubrerythrin
MNLLNIFDQIHQVDPEVYGRMDTRRKAMSQFAGFSSKVAMAAVPAVLGSMFKKAYAQSSTEDVIGILNYALALEYLEKKIYRTAIDAATALGITSDIRIGLQRIFDDETAHVALLTGAINGLRAGAAISEPNIDVTGGKGVTGTPGPFAVAFTTKEGALAAIQVFEDTGVRAYKGQAGFLLGTDTLTVALNIHSVEARHASYIRKVRSELANNPYADLKPWITNKQPSTPFDGLVSLNYDSDSTSPAEDNGTQLNIAIASTAGNGVSSAQASESFDEPLTKEKVLSLVGVPNAGVGAATALFFY